MRLLIVLITHNRSDYTKLTLKALKSTITLPHYLVAVDNASSDATAIYLMNQKKEGKIDNVIINEDNLYPGKACNMGWIEGLKNYPSATHLMRLDNDMSLEPGWDTLAQEYFDKIPQLGQVGLDFDGGEEKLPKMYNGMTLYTWPYIVGGPCIIRREIFDSGVRYDETPWRSQGYNRPTEQEDAKLSREIKKEGYIVGHMSKRLSYTFATKDNWKSSYPEYYKKTMAERGYDGLLEEIGL